MHIEDLSSFDFVMIEGAKKSARGNFSNENNAVYYKEATYAQVGVKKFVDNSFSMFYAATYYEQDSYLGSAIQKQFYVQIDNVKN